MLTCAITTYHGHLRLGSTGTETKDVGHLSHHCLSAYGTHQSVERTRLDTGISKARTTGVSATATVGLRQHLGNLTHTWILLYSKFLRYDKQHRGQYQGCKSQSNHCN